MKYFTPDLLKRFGSEDDTIADQAHAEWESASRQYQRHFRSIEKELPQTLRAVFKKFYLHDARVFGMSSQPRVLSLTMQLDSPPHEALVFQYLLLKAVEVHRHGGQSDPCPYLEWLYDEVSVKTVDNIKYFEHAVLLTGGTELQIPFLDFQCLVQPPPRLGLFGSKPFGAALQRPQLLFNEADWLSLAGEARMAKDVGKKGRRR